MGDSAKRAEQLLHDLSMVAHRLEDAAVAAEQGREALEDAIVRATALRDVPPPPTTRPEPPTPPPGAVPHVPPPR